MWDAEHAPQNVGMSHNVLARTSRDGDETVVEAITKVQSIDLVADPATTAGLFEQRNERAESTKSQSQIANSAPAHRFDSLTLERACSFIGPIWCASCASRRRSQLEELRGQLDQLDRSRGDGRDGASGSWSCWRSTVCRRLRPAKAWRESIVSPQFHGIADRCERRRDTLRLVEERAELVRSAAVGQTAEREATGRGRAINWRCSWMRMLAECGMAVEFARAICGR